MRIKTHNIKANLWILFGSAVLIIFGIVMIIKAPQDSESLNSLPVASVTEDKERVSLSGFYPVGTLGSETVSGKEYTYYLAAYTDSLGMDCLTVIRSQNGDIGALLESTSPSPFAETIYGSVKTLDGEPKSAFDKIISDENLSEKYKCTQWYFDDSSLNFDSETSIAIVCAFTLMIFGGIMIYIFIKRITK